MIRVMKSPNMMSTTGLRPVMAAPTPMPVNPGSEMGVSITRFLPNSSTNPDKTLKGVPASATSSPRTHTRGSRRISSAMASRTASPKVISRTFVWVAVSGIHILVDFIHGRIGRRNGIIHGCVHFLLHFGLHAIQRRGVRQFLLDQPLAEDSDGIALGGPALLFLFGAVILAIDVADVMAAVAIGISQQKRRPFAAARALHHAA